MVTAGGVNVFADIGRPNPEVGLLKAELARRVSAAIARKGWTQAEAAAVIGVDQAKVSAVVRGRLSGFTMDRLTEWLTRLGETVRLAP